MWKRYFIGFIKLGPCVLFSIFFQKTGSIIIRLGRHGKSLSKDIEVSARSKERTAILNMPVKVTRESIEDTKKLIPFFKENDIIINFKNTVYLDLYAMGFLVRLWKQCMSHKKSLYFTSLTPFLSGLLKYNRLWDICDKLHHDNPEILPETIKIHNDSYSFYYTTDPGRDIFKINLCGRLDASNISKLDIQELTKNIGNKNCILNLKKLNFVDSTGLIFFIRIKKHLALYHKKPIICNVNEDIRQLLNITKLLNFFKILPEYDVNKDLVKETI